MKRPFCQRIPVRLIAYLVPAVGGLALPGCGSTLPSRHSDAATHLAVVPTLMPPTPIGQQAPEEMPRLSESTPVSQSHLVLASATRTDQQIEQDIAVYLRNTEQPFAVVPVPKNFRGTARSYVQGARRIGIDYENGEPVWFRLYRNP